jgi:hypothetical protein
MKENLITNNHFDYATKIMKIIGFQSISDFETSIYYTKLKEQEINICLKISKTIDEFKKLFPLNEFDLRRIKYKFENINQIVGFIKKLTSYLAIPLNITRINNSTILRLIQSKYFLYNNYINSMNNRDTTIMITNFKKTIDEIKNNEKIETKIENKEIKNKEIENKEIENKEIENKEIKTKIEKESTETEINKKHVKSSQVLKFKKALSFEKEFIVESCFSLSYFRDFKWVNWIKVAIFSDGDVDKLNDGCKIELLLGGSIVSRHKIDQSTLFEDNYFKIPVDFFNNHFYMYHFFEIKIFSNKRDQMFKIIVNGNDFTKKLPKSYLENKMAIECDHDLKYCGGQTIDSSLYGFGCRIMSGLTGFCSREFELWDDAKKNFEEYVKNGDVIYNKSSLLLKRKNDDKIEPRIYYDYLLKNNLLINYDYVAIYDYSIIHYLYIEEENDENSVIYYSNPYYNFHINFLSIISHVDNDVKIETVPDTENKYVNKPFVKVILKSNKIKDYLKIEVMVELYYSDKYWQSYS